MAIRPTDLQSALIVSTQAPPINQRAEQAPIAAQNAATMAFTLPMWLGSQYAQAHIAIDRDAPEQQGKRGLDGDNFHIAFVLDTKHLGPACRRWRRRQVGSERARMNNNSAYFNSRRHAPDRPAAAARRAAPSGSGPRRSALQARHRHGDPARTLRRRRRGAGLGLFRRLRGRRILRIS